MKKVLFIILILICSQSISSQTNMEDVVYLKNGSIIRGTITEMIPNESIKIKSDRNVFVYKMSEILKTTKEELTEQTSLIKNSNVEQNIDDSELKNILINKVNSESNGNLKLIYYTKDDRLKKNIDGIDIYIVYFTMVFYANNDIYYSGKEGFYSGMNGVWSSFKVNDKPLDGYSAYAVGGQSTMTRGSAKLLKGEVKLYKTEKSIKYEGLHFKKWQDVDAASYSQDLIEKKKKEDEEIKIINSKKEQEWLKFQDSLKLHWGNVAEGSRALREISDSFKKIKDFPNAIIFYHRYMEYEVKTDFNSLGKSNYIDLGRLYALNNEFEKADSFLNDILKENPNNSYIYHIKAQNQFSKDSNTIELVIPHYLKYIEIEKKSKKSNSKNKAISNQYYQIAKLYKRKDNLEMCLKNLNFALEYDKENKFAQNLLEEISKK